SVGRASLGSAVGGGWVELFERLDRGGEQDAETLARRGAHVGRGAGEAMEDRMTNGFVRARKRREELPEPERMIEDDRFEHRCVRIRGALVREEGAPSFGRNAVSKGRGQLALLARELRCLRIVTEGGGDRVLRRIVFDRRDRG